LIYGSPDQFRLVRKGKPVVIAGYRWSFDRCILAIKRQIYQYKNSKLIGKYSSLPEAAKALGVKSHNSIDNAIKGIVQKEAYGCTWESKENLIINICEDQTQDL
jgi:hypothetical protein